MVYRDKISCICPVFLKNIVIWKSFHENLFYGERWFLPMQKSLTNLFIAKKDLPRDSCHCDGTCPQFLSLRWNLRSVLVIAMEGNDRSNLLASRSPHCVRDDNLLTDGHEAKSLSPWQPWTWRKFIIPLFYSSDSESNRGKEFVLLCFAPKWIISFLLNLIII